MNKPKPILSQDDCAPDSSQYFQERFKSLMGISLHEFKVTANEFHGEDYFKWETGTHYLIIAADWPFYELYKYKEQSK